MRILVIGANGLIGSTLLRILSCSPSLTVFGSVRTLSAKLKLAAQYDNQIHVGLDVLNPDEVMDAFTTIRPDVVINCAGITKHLDTCNDPLICIPTNALAPHRLARLCELVGSRFIHISTDCVFTGDKGSYVESDIADSADLYGRSKSLGEVNYSNSLVLRSSTIGHEKNSTNGLLEWFLAQKVSCLGFSNAIFSGLPTVTLAEIVRDYVLPNSQLTGLYHLSADPINKFELLKLISKVYSKDIEIIDSPKFVIDRSLDCSKFKSETGFQCRDWEELIFDMYSDFGGGKNV